MYYDMNPGSRINEWITNVYENLLAWIDRQTELPLFGHKWVRDPSAERVSVDLEEGQITEFDDPD